MSRGSSGNRRRHSEIPALSSPSQRDSRAASEVADSTQASNQNTLATSQVVPPPASSQESATSDACLMNGKFTPSPFFFFQITSESGLHTGFLGPLLIY